MKWYVYALYREDGTPFYVGRGTKARWGSHERATRRGEVQGNRQKYEIIKAILALGKAINKKKLGIFATMEEASAFEVAMIARIGRTANGGPLVNRTDGGDGGLSGIKVSKETREKISKAVSGKKRSPEFCKSVSMLHTGRVWDREVVERRASKIRGRKYSKEHCQKLSDARKGVPLSEAHAAALRGKKRSPESCERMRKAAIAAWKRRREL